MSAADLAVIGGGAAGLFAIREVIRHQPALSVLWFAPEAHPGAAWATDCPSHLLNVPVERMGAREPGDFLHWLQAQSGERSVTAGEFLPRICYGDYLLALRDALPATVRRIPARVEQLLRHPTGWMLQGATETACARRVIVAVGMPRPTATHPLQEAWDWWFSEAPLANEAEVLLVGSGLTAVDMVLGLRQRGHRGLITVISPTGRWPESHTPTTPMAAEATADLIADLRAASSGPAIVARLRAAAEHWPWRAVIDALRASSNSIWESWPAALRARLLRHAFATWNLYRHRMAPAAATQLAGDAQLLLLPGRVKVDQGRLWRVHRGIRSELQAALALDCRGPPFAALSAGNRWLRCLLDQGELDAHPLGSGLSMPLKPDLALIGAANFGALFETTAVPELRAQASALADRWFGPGAGATHRDAPPA